MENKPDNKKLDTFFLAFVGQQITVTTTLMVSAQESSVDLSSFPVYYEGILLDFDDEYFYLGRNAIEINQAVARKQVAHIIVSEEIDPFTEILNGMPKGNVN